MRWQSLLWRKYPRLKKKPKAFSLAHTFVLTSNSIYVCLGERAHLSGSSPVIVSIFELRLYPLGQPHPWFFFTLVPLFGFEDYYRMHLLVICFSLFFLVTQTWWVTFYNPPWYLLPIHKCSEVDGFLGSKTKVKIEMIEWKGFQWGAFFIQSMDDLSWSAELRVWLVDISGFN